MHGSIHVHAISCMGIAMCILQNQGWWCFALQTIYKQTICDVFLSVIDRYDLQTVFIWKFKLMDGTM